MTHRDIMAPDVVITAEQIPDEEHDDQEQEAKAAYRRVNEHDEVTLHRALPSCQRSAERSGRVCPERFFLTSSHDKAPIERQPAQ